MIGILALLALAGAAAAIYWAGGPVAAWNALGLTIHTTCQNDVVCNLLFSFLFKICPFLFLGLFAFGIWEKQTQFPSPRRGTYFTHISFGQDGVLLEKPGKANNLFFPYEKTSLDMTASVHQVRVKNIPVTAVSKVEFTLMQTGGQFIKIKLMPPRRVMAFFCRILDKRNRFAQFSYKMVPLLPFYDTEAQALSKKLENYCETGFLSSFGSAGERLGFIAVGAVCLLGAIYVFVSVDMGNFFSGILLALMLFGAGLIFFAGKDGYSELKSRKK